jgi:hypothetical protein
MKLNTILCIAALAAASSALADTPESSNASRTRHIRITYENLTAGQAFSPSAFFSHNASAPPFFVEGKPAPFGLQRIAEEGNTGGVSGAVVTTLGGAFGALTLGVTVPPGGSRTVTLEVSQEHPLVTGVWMLGMTNDGFTGIHDMDAYSLTRPQRMDLFAWDAGTEKNNERGDFLIAMEGTERDPENGVVHRHEGIRGDADAPGSWKFDPERPVARITLTPIR